MNDLSPPADSPAIVAARDKLARLGVQVDAMQAVLVRLLQDVVVAEKRFDRSQAAQLAEVNEQLVVAALTTQAEAEAAAQALQAAARSVALDPLTGLPNRGLLLDRLEQAIAGARRHGSSFALLFLDIDAFKAINDALGHAGGDAVLCAVAGRLVAAVRESDTVSRHGGDEFLVLMPDLHTTADALAVAEKLVVALGVPLQLQGLTLQITASIGIAVHPEDGEDAATLVASADAAMYQTKRQRAGGIAFHGAPALHVATGPVDPGEAGDPGFRSAMLREANERLVVAAMTAHELKEAAELAQRRQAALVAAVAEELRNPAAPVRIAASMLGREPVVQALLPQVQGIVEQQMTRMSRLVGQLVDVAHVDGAALVLQQLPVDMRQRIDAAVAACMPAMLARSQHFSSQLPDGPLPLTGDAERLEQLVFNLLDNASKHAHDDGHIQLQAVVEADTLVLTVSDDGLGITQQMLPLIFEPFVQDTRALGFNGIGLGIGLTVVRALVLAHGGSIVAHSAGANQGSSFVVRLPLAAASVQGAP